MGPVDSFSIPPMTKMHNVFQYGGAGEMIEVNECKVLSKLLYCSVITTWIAGCIFSA